MKPLLFSLFALAMLAVTIVVGHRDYAIGAVRAGHLVAGQSVAGCARLASFTPAQQAQLQRQLAEIEQLKAQQGGLSHADAALLDVRIDALQSQMISACQPLVSVSASPAERRA
jgi:hypothetical protein